MSKYEYFDEDDTEYMHEHSTICPYCGEMEFMEAENLHL